MENKICKQCGKEYDKPYNESLKNWNKRIYCSRLCKQKSPDVGIKVGNSNRGKSKNLGHIVSKETREKIGKANRGHRARKGKDCNFRKGGNSELYKNERYKLMATSEYKIWRRGVFERDYYRCRSCGDDIGGNLNAHHIKPRKDYPELRFALDNGLTLCKKCHIIIHKKTRYLALS